MACAVISTAIKDMRDRDARHRRTRIDATVWMATKAATLWFDASGVNQGYALSGMDWSSHAQHLLDGEAGRMPYWDGDESSRPKALSPEQSKMLRDGLDYFDSIRGERLDASGQGERF